MVIGIIQTQRSTGLKEAFGRKYLYSVRLSPRDICLVCLLLLFSTLSFLSLLDCRTFLPVVRSRRPTRVMSTEWITKPFKVLSQWRCCLQPMVSRLSRLSRITTTRCNHDMKYKDISDNLDYTEKIRQSLMLIRSSWKEGIVMKSFISDLRLSCVCVEKQIVANREHCATIRCRGKAVTASFSTRVFGSYHSLTFHTYIFYRLSTESDSLQLLYLSLSLVSPLS